MFLCAAVFIRSVVSSLFFFSWVWHFEPQISHQRMFGSHSLFFCLSCSLNILDSYISNMCLLLLILHGSMVPRMSWRCRQIRRKRFYIYVLYYYIHIYEYTYIDIWTYINQYQMFMNSVWYQMLAYEHSYSYQYKYIIFMHIYIKYIKYMSFELTCAGIVQ